MSRLDDLDAIGPGNADEAVDIMVQRPVGQAEAMAGRKADLAIQRLGIDQRAIAIIDDEAKPGRSGTCDLNHSVDSLGVELAGLAEAPEIGRNDSLDRSRRQPQPLKSAPLGLGGVG